MYNISKELFEAVMDNSYEFFEIGYCNIFEQYTIYFGGIIDDEVCNSISVDTFFFKCKEWTLDKGYMIVTFGNGYFIYDIEELYDPMEQLDRWIKDGLSTSEQQAVFDAGEWIRKELLK